MIGLPLALHEGVADEAVPAPPPRPRCRTAPGAAPPASPRTASPSRKPWPHRAAPTNGVRSRSVSASAARVSPPTRHRPGRPCAPTAEMSPPTRRPSRLEAASARATTRGKIAKRVPRAPRYSRAPRCLVPGFFRARRARRCGTGDPPAVRGARRVRSRRIVGVQPSPRVIVAATLQALGYFPDRRPGAGTRPCTSVETGCWTTRPDAHAGSSRRACR